MQSLPVAFASLPGGIEWVVIGLVALLFFGKRLPAVARSLGETFTEFKRGLSGINRSEHCNQADKDDAKPRDIAGSK